MLLHACMHCRRHVAIDEHVCPFCRGALITTSARVTAPGRLSRAAVFAGATLTSAACYTSPPLQSSPPPPPIERPQVVEQTPVEPPPDPQTFANPPPDTARATIRGTVIDRRTRQPKPKAIVQLRVPNRPVIQAVTDDRGEYVFANLAPGRYIVATRTEDLRNDLAERRVDLHAGRDARVDLESYESNHPDHPIAAPYGAPPNRRRLV